MASTSDGLDLVDRVQQLARRVQRHLESVQTEEATKTALVLPFIADVLGYNVFDPTEVVPEFTADVGTKKGEKVDYAILRDGKPILLFECKRYGADLCDSAKSQLYCYFGVTESRVAVLTDGVTYRFFSDVDAPNKMDDRPFYEFDLRSVDEADAKEISRFTRSSFDAEALQGQAQDLKYTREVLSLIEQEWTAPSPAFVRLFSKRVYPRTHTKKVVSQFTGITKRALRQFLRNRLEAQITRVLEGTDAIRRTVSAPVPTPPPPPTQSAAAATAAAGNALITSRVMSQRSKPWRPQSRPRRTMTRSWEGTMTTNWPRLPAVE